MSMKIGNQPFFERVEKNLKDPYMRQAMASVQDRLRGRKLSATVNDESLVDWEMWRNAGEEIRTHTLNHLDVYLEQLSDNFAARGGHVFFAETAEEARLYIKELVKKKKSKKCRQGQIHGH